MQNESSMRLNQTFDGFNISETAQNWRRRHDNPMTAAMQLGGTLALASSICAIVVYSFSNMQESRARMFQDHHGIRITQPR